MFLPLLSVGSAAQDYHRNRKKRKKDPVAILKRSLEYFKMRYFKAVP